jgi:transglutaminase-like putative cysteine protease
MIRIGDLTNLVTYACAGLGFLAVAPHVGRVSAFGFWILLAAGAFQDFRRAFLAPRWLLNVISLGVLAAAFWRLRLDYLVEPVLDALLVLVGIKLLEEKKNRDHLQVLALCAFLLAGASLLSIHISFLIHYGLLALLATLALVCLTFHSRAPGLVLDRELMGQCLLQGLLICAFAIPASGLFFVILPRTNTPLFTFLNKVSGARTGFSDSISLGQVAAIQEDDSVVFRAEMDRVDDERLYWRGIVLDVVEGDTWRSSRPESVGTVRATGGETVQQIIYLEPYGGRVLFGLDRPVSIRFEERGIQREVTQFRHPIQERVRYRVASNPRVFLAESDAESEAAANLHLPEDFSMRIRELVTTLAPSGSRGEKVVALFNHLRSGAFSYSLEDLPVSSRPLEDFLLAHRRGNCEYFASALGVMLRAAGVPARLVGGYRGGLYNRSGRYYLVQQKNAHVWVEAYMHGQGWMRLDPTPLGLDFGPLSQAAGALGRLRVLMDTFNHYWIKLVINYDLERQFRIVRGIREHWSRQDFRWRPGKVPVIHIGMAAAGGAVVILTLLWASRRRKEPERKLLEELARRMRKRGVVKGASEGLDEFTAKIEDEDLRKLAERFAEGFQELYYRDRSFSDDDRRRLRAIIRRI